MLLRENVYFTSFIAYPYDVVMEYYNHLVHKWTKYKQ